MKTKILLSTLLLTTALQADGVAKLEAKASELPTSQKSWTIYASADAIARHNMVGTDYSGIQNEYAKASQNRFHMHPGLSLGGRNRFANNIIVGIEGNVVFGAQKNLYRFTMGNPNFTINAIMTNKNTYSYAFVGGYHIDPLLFYAKVGQCFRAMRVGIDYAPGGFPARRRVDYFKKNQSGILLAGGAEYSINQRLSAALEYEHGFYKAWKLPDLDGGEPIRIKLRPQTSSFKLRLIAKI